MNRKNWLYKEVKFLLFIFYSIDFELLDYVDNVREKRPAYQFKSGAVYDGEWKGSMRDGVGIQTWPDGAKYEGKYKLFI